jgi:hypothetical protein
MISSLLSRIFILVLGTLYPAYASYKAVRTKNIKEYVKWMMYWIVFALFTCAETFFDLLISWLPFYYEVKILFVIWLLSPATKGSSILYRRFVHPLFAKREQEIDSYIQQAGDQGYMALLSIGTKGLNYAANVVISTAVMGQAKIIEQIKHYNASEADSVPSNSFQPFVTIKDEQDSLDPSMMIPVNRFSSTVIPQPEDADSSFDETDDSDHHYLRSRSTTTHKEIDAPVQKRKRSARSVSTKRS